MVAIPHLKAVGGEAHVAGLGDPRIEKFAEAGILRP